LLLDILSFTQKIAHDGLFNGVEDFISYTLSNPKYISGDGIRCPCKRCKNKCFLIQILLWYIFYKKKFMEKYLCWFALWEPYVPYKTLIEMMVESTSSFSNVYGVVDDNNNNCRSMVIDAMIMN